MLTSFAMRREDSMMDFLQECLGEGQQIIIHPVAGDASFRRYFRVESLRGRFIVMDAPPERENSSPFVDIARFLGGFGVLVPQVVHAQLDKGYLLLEDFGDTTFLNAIDNNHDPDNLYRLAVETLLQIQTTPKDGSCIAHQRFYDRAMLLRELALFTDWYIEKIQDKIVSTSDRVRFEKVFDVLVDTVLQQPVVFVHRDYHSRNLMWHKKGVGVLDFQDAVIGPITYDLASLLRDCYVAWDADFRQRIMALWLEGARKRLDYNPPTWQVFQKDFDWMALHRNLKAVGIFGRLSQRDGKHGYLKDIPRTLTYVHQTIAQYPELEDLGVLMEVYGI